MNNLSRSISIAALFIVLALIIEAIAIFSFGKLGLRNDPLGRAVIYIGLGPWIEESVRALVIGQVERRNWNPAKYAVLTGATIGVFEVISKTIGWGVFDAASIVVYLASIPIHIMLSVAFFSWQRRHRWVLNVCLHATLNMVVALLAYLLTIIGTSVSSIVGAFFITLSMATLATAVLAIIMTRETSDGR